MRYGVLDVIALLLTSFFLAALSWGEALCCPLGFLGRFFIESVRFNRELKRIVFMVSVP